jgi:hypothetical protein
MEKWQQETLLLREKVSTLENKVRELEQEKKEKQNSVKSL